MNTSKTVNKKDNKNSVPQKSLRTFFISASLILILLTTAIYYKSLNNSFTRWDDNKYVTENATVKSFHGDSLNITFKNIVTSYIMGNYHPITMLSYCLEYNKHKLDPKPYHRNNLILHILNSLLVLCFIWLLTKKKWVAFITALLFSIHPMHVESVAWVAERKDVLYSFFYLAGLCTYLLYLEKEKGKWLFYGLTFLLFCFGVLSKAMAVSLPIVFFAIDYFLDRKITRNTLLEKVPFISMALIFGYIAIEAQKSINALSLIQHYNFFDRILFTGYALMMYLSKLLFPAHLSPFYDYPIAQEGIYPVAVYIAPVLMLALAFFIYRSVKFGKELIFGFFFFLITIALVLQILPVGGAIIADRYSYLPYIGIFFILAQGINNVREDKYEKLKAFKNVVVAALVLLVFGYSYLAFQRTKIWKNTITVWSDAIEQFDQSPQSFNGRGDGYIYIGQYDKALIDLDRAIQLKANYPDAYYNRGLAYYYLGKHEESIKDYTSAIQYNPTLACAYFNRAGSYFILKQYQPALADALKAQQLGSYVDPKFIEALQINIKNSGSN